MTGKPDVSGEYENGGLVSLAPRNQTDKVPWTERGQTGRTPSRPAGTLPLKWDGKQERTRGTMKTANVAKIAKYYLKETVLGVCKGVVLGVMVFCEVWLIMALTGAL